MAENDKSGDVIALVQTVRGNYERYTKREVLQAKEARHGQAMIGNPSKKDYRRLVSGNRIANCPFSPHNVLELS
jgi:hypothetical protein